MNGYGLISKLAAYGRWAVAVCVCVRACVRVCVLNTEPRKPDQVPFIQLSFLLLIIIHCLHKQVTVVPRQILKQPDC